MQSSRDGGALMILNPPYRDVERVFSGSDSLHLAVFLWLCCSLLVVPL